MVRLYFSSFAVKSGSLHISFYIFIHFVNIFFSSTSSLILWDLCDEIKQLNELKVPLLLV